MDKEKPTANQRRKQFLMRSKKAPVRTDSTIDDDSSIGTTSSLQNEYLSKDPNQKESVIETGGNSLGEILESKSQEYDENKKKNPDANKNKNWSAVGVPTEEKNWADSVSSEKSRSDGSNSIER